MQYLSREKLAAKSASLAEMQSPSRWNPTTCAASSAGGAGSPPFLRSHESAIPASRATSLWTSLATTVRTDPVAQRCSSGRPRCPAGARRAWCHPPADGRSGPSEQT
eukprot:scaffold58_cov256-Pinguiococcus_pyrenoidosus.AAC.21